jgi:hypothetical protein
MAEFAIHEDMYRSEEHKLAFRYLKREHDAVISRGTKSGEFWLYLVNGNGLPPAKKAIGVYVEWLVPKVAIVKVDF